MSILDGSEQAFVFAHMHSEIIWIGLGDIKESSNVAFWSDGNQMSLHNWAAASFDRSIDQCAYMNGTDGKWYLHSCSDPLQYVCKVSNDKPTPNPSKRGFCTEGFDDMIPDSDYCYKIKSKKDNGGNDAAELWSEAEMACREQGAQLASLHSEAETAAILLNWNPKSSDGLWIGLIAYRDGIGLGPSWRWSDLSNTSDYKIWDDQYPQNMHTSTPQCAYLTTEGYWRNHDCTLSDYGTPTQHVCKARKELAAPLPSKNTHGLSRGSKAAVGTFIILGIALMASAGLVFAKKKNFINLPFFDKK